MSFANSTYGPSEMQLPTGQGSFQLIELQCWEKGRRYFSQRQGTHCSYKILPLRRVSKENFIVSSLNKWTNFHCYSSVKTVSITRSDQQPDLPILHTRTSRSFKCQSRVSINLAAFKAQIITVSCNPWDVPNSGPRYGNNSTGSANHVMSKTEKG